LDGAGVCPRDSAKNEDTDPREFVANGEVSRVIEVTLTLTTVEVSSRVSPFQKGHTAMKILGIDLGKFNSEVCLFWAS
jgi:hypothetical protein